MRLTDKKKKLLGLSVLAFIVCVFGLVGYWLFQENSKTYVEKVPAKFKSIQLFGNDKFVLVSVDAKQRGDSIYYGQNYVSTTSVRSLDTENTKTSPPIGKDEYYKLISYDLNSSELSKKELDLYRLLNPDSGYRNSAGLLNLYGNGKDFIEHKLYTYKNNNYDEIRMLIDINAGDFSTKNVAEKNSEMTMNNPYRKEVSTSPGGISDSLDEQLAKYHLWEIDGSIRPDWDDDVDYRNKIDISDTNFAQLYPEVAKNMKDMDRLYFRPEQYNQKEWFDNLLHWFAPQGQDVMEVYATDSATGEKTQIKSFDEYLAWRDAHPEEVKKYERSG